MKRNGKQQQIRSNQAKKVIDQILTQDNISLINHRRTDGFIRVQYDDGVDIMPISGSSIFVQQIAWTHFETSLSDATVKQIHQTLNANAIFGRDASELNSRVAHHDGSIWYDLGRSVVRISSNGWEIVTDPPNIFKRYSQGKRQVIPQLGGNYWDLHNFFFITPEQRLLFACWVLASFIPGIPHPALVLHGSQGAAKSSTMKVLLKLIDPSQNEDAQTDDENQLLLNASHRHVLPLDNLSMVSPRMSDLLCKIITGSGRVRRKLFSDEDEVINQLQNVVIMNGINIPASRPDLLDRCTTINLQRIPSELRLDEKTLRERFDRQLPFILGDCFTLVSKAMALYPEIQLTKLFRLADFTKWGAAFAQALGHSKEEFMAAYQQNQNDLTEESLLASPLGRAIKYYMGDHEVLEGTPTSILIKLNGVAYEAGVNPRDLPENAYSFGRQFNSVQTNLEQCGMHVEFKRSRERIYRISNSSKAGVRNVETSVVQQTLPLNSDDCDVSDMLPEENGGPS
ncbi:hypothetical protein [Bdellovibrio bacteriovorus]|uniref:ATP-binding protein n=1 Tax=Bdellovibrio bacteriovorus str. Tiberius TaxID=1069642 RepID=K7YJW1_BDEBC|nr:hypothetical protein [Bdellovibrio bacteriovorus]AFX99950.1 hypothetical protein Bdt_0242 [Bdellovibrio bacteriovorus str. Tiberius]